VLWWLGLDLGLFIFHKEFFYVGIVIVIKFAKMHFWSLYFEPILDLVPKLILLLM